MSKHRLCSISSDLLAFLSVAAKWNINIVINSLSTECIGIGATFYFHYLASGTVFLVFNVSFKVESDPAEPCSVTFNSRQPEALDI